MSVGRTEAVAVRSRGAGHGGEAGRSVQAGGFSASSLAGLLDHVDGMWLEGEAHVDLDDAARAEGKDEHSVEPERGIQNKKPG